MHLFVFGYGYSAAALRRRLGPQVKVSATCRSAAKADELKAKNVQPHIFDGQHPMQNAQEALQDVTHLLLSIPPDEKGDPVLRLHRQDILQSMPTLNWAGYLSTTAVYGDHQGNWVSEKTVPTPMSDRGKRRLDTERAWIKFCTEAGLPLTVFRIAGIYGPGRNVLEDLRQGTARRIFKAEQVFSRIHVDDLANVLLVALVGPGPESSGPAIFNVCDDEPAPPQDVVAYGAKLLNMPPPDEIPFEKADLSPMSASFYAENKRVLNWSLQDDLGVTLVYPTYREGLEALKRTL